MRHVIQHSLASATVTLALFAALRAQVPVRPAFEVGAIKPAGGCGNGFGGSGAPEPGRLHLPCAQLRVLVQIAYGMFADGATQSPVRTEVLGGPAWADSDLYDINAKAAGSVTIGQTYGPMLQALLEERFKLKVHKELREQPVYTLTVGKNGSKLKPTSCTQVEPDHMPPPLAPGQVAPKVCGRGSIQQRGGLAVVESYGATLAYFAGSMLPNTNALDRPVLDQTGLDGRFDIHLEYAPTNPAQAPGPTPPDPAGASIFTAVQEQLGLKLTAGKGPVAVLVIDHAERPTGN
jgi:uncharacterized protein (TIGR03435 family)